MSSWGIGILGGVAVLLWPARAQLRQSRQTSPARRTSSAVKPDEAVLTVMDSMCTTLRAGSPPAQALRLAVEPFHQNADEVATQLVALAEVAAADGDVPQAWEQLAADWETPVLADVAAAWRLSARQGCPLAEALDAAAVNIRAHRAHTASVRTAVAGARATVAVLVGLPVLGLGIGLLLGVDVLSLYRGRSGLMTFWPGVTLIAIGMAWVNRQTRRAVEPKLEDTTS